MKQAPLWPDPSQVFSDTQRVDLFNDPRWESPPDSPGRRLPAERPAPARRRSGALAYWRSMTKRGQHSRS